MAAKEVMKKMLLEMKQGSFDLKKERAIRIGQLEREYLEYDEFVLYEGEICIDRETEKAIKIKFAGSATILTDSLKNGGKRTEVYEKVKSVWLPKSQCRIESDTIIIPLWLAEKNDLCAYLMEA
ncbi:hypothetical protein [Bacillus smithii]|uniref:hypothetical protein n=1 Tax=Bacillus smithii TaxID=1479 RepID=UPI00077BB925|nr:hypothetical protein [Bacillus smithii]